ncbi:hypothetical protein C8T65DRAFT_660340 [Cerioporus squamosus]|nr:hypothetical protein C8T65DRAFT_660340 [Cerioporus squamosus]
MQSSFPVHLRFLNENPLNSRVVEGANTDRALYEISTKAVSGVENVRMRTVIRDGQTDDVVAVWERTPKGSERSEDRITYHESTRLLADWLPHPEGSARAQTFDGPDGEEYVWERHKKHKGVFTLINTRTQKSVAETHHSRGVSLRPSARPGMRIDMKPEASGIADAILLSFVIIEQLRREAEVTTVRSSVPDKVVDMVKASTKLVSPAGSAGAV